MRNIFLKNHAQNVAEKLVPDPFLKNQNLVYLWIKSLKFYTDSRGLPDLLKLNQLARLCYDDVIVAWFYCFVS